MASIWDYITPGLTDEQKRQALQAAQVSAESLQRTPQALMDMFSQQLPEGALQAQYDIDPQKAIGMGMEAMFAAPAGITAWHGSPFKFGAFDPTKIGSGEGAQAYGYGHYLAESPGVASGYKNSVTSTKYDTTDGVESAGTLIQKIIDLSGNKTPSLNSAISMKANEVVRDMILGTPAKDIVSNIRNSKFARTYSGIADALETLRPQKAIGNVYKIDLPDEHVAKMLNWDQELGQQTPEIMKLAKQHGLAMDDLGGDLVARMDAKTPAGAEAMRQAGVPGIKYFDAQSRGGKMADTQNFVVFPGNEGLLKMLEMNDKPMSFWGF